MTLPHSVLIVGVGSIGERHLRCFQSMERAEVSFVEVNSALRATIAERYGVRGFADLEAALADSGRAAPNNSLSTVAFALSQVGGPSDIDPLLKALASETDNVARAFLVNALANLGHARGYQELIRNLDSADATVRTVATEAAGHARCVDCRAKLIQLLDNSTLDTRVRSAQSLIVLSLPARKR